MCSHHRLDHFYRKYLKSDMNLRRSAHHEYNSNVWITITCIHTRTWLSIPGSPGIIPSRPMKLFPSLLPPGEEKPSLDTTPSNSYCWGHMLLGSCCWHGRRGPKPHSSSTVVFLDQASLLMVTSGGHISNRLGLGSLGIGLLLIIDTYSGSFFLLLLKIWVQRTVLSSHVDLSH